MAAPLSTTKYKDAAALEKKCQAFFYKYPRSKVWAPRKFRNFLNVTGANLNHWKTNRPKLFETFHKYQTLVLARLEEQMLLRRVDPRSAAFILKAYDRELYMEPKMPIITTDGVEHIQINVSNKASAFEKLIKEK